MASLDDLSRVPKTTAEIVAFNSVLDKESDRGAAILASALVEVCLRRAICANIIDPGEDTLRQWFDTGMAPFRSFSAKIVLGRALGIYGEELESQLRLIKDIRNRFAHTAIPLDFRHPAIADMNATLMKPLSQVSDEDPKILFGRACRVYASILTRHTQRRKVRQVLDDMGAVLRDTPRREAQPE